MELSLLLLLLFFFSSIIFWFAASTRLGEFFFTSPLRNLPGPPRQSWLTGNLFQLFARDSFKFHMDIIRNYGTAVKVHGPTGQEQLYITDPIALQCIFQKSQPVFKNTPEFVVQGLVLIGPCLMTFEGQEHSKQRKILNPAFSVKHVKSLTDIFYPIAYELQQKLMQKIQHGQTEIDILLWLSKATLELIGQGGLGHKFDALDESKTNAYSEAVKLLSPMTFSPISTFLRFQSYIFVQLGLPWLPRKLLDWVPLKTARKFRGILEIMRKTSEDVFEKRIALFAEGKDKVDDNKDLMSLLLKANLEATGEECLPLDLLMNHMTLFTFAGYDTNATAVSRILQILALDKNLQERIRHEIRDAKSQYGDLNYDELMKLPLLDAVCRETLRLYPPLAFLGRTPREDTILPLFTPIKSLDGKTEISEIPVKKGTYMHISIVGANRNKDVWGDDADQFKPERWMSSSPIISSKVQLPGVYSSMMTFMGGPHSCIGLKFAELEMKLLLFVLLNSIHFSPTEDEIEWCLPGIQCPMLKNSDGTPSLPLKISIEA